MAYKKRRFKRRRATGTNWMGMAKKAYKTAMYLKSVLNPERLFFDTNTTGTIGTTASINSQVLIAQGDTVSGRTGNSIKCSSIYIVGNIKINAAAANTVLRMILFIDEQCQGAVPAAADVLQNTDVESPLNISTVSTNRFKVLFDKRCMLTSQGQQQVQLSRYIKWQKHVKFTNTTGVIASVGSGNVVLLLLADDNTNQPTVDIRVRVRYYDN